MDHAVTALVAVQVAAFWPVWRWLAGRVVDDAEAGGMAAALLAALLLPSPAGGEPRPRALWFAAAFTAAYAATFHFVPPLIRALFALLSLAGTVGAMRGEASGFARHGLFLLAAPVVPTLQFYLGYPLRVLVTHLAAVWLRCAGIGARVEGLGLAWNEKLVLVDAPCSGVRMIWGALLMALATAVLRGFGPVRTSVVVAAGLLAAVGANSLRAAALFFTEAGLVALPGAHDAVGVLVFAAISAATAAAARRAGACS